MHFFESGLFAFGSPFFYSLVFSTQGKLPTFSRVWISSFPFNTGGKKKKRKNAGAGNRGEFSNHSPKSFVPPLIGLSIFKRERERETRKNAYECGRLFEAQMQFF